MGLSIQGYEQSDVEPMLDLFNQQTAHVRHVARLTSRMFAELVEAKSYFDPAGVLVARSGGDVVGWIHACVAPGSESWQDPKQSVARIRMLVYRPEDPRVGYALVERATAWLEAGGAKTMLAWHAQSGYPFYRGLWFGGESMCPATMPHLHMAFEVGGYKVTQQSVFFTANMADEPAVIEPEIAVEFNEHPAEMAHEPMRQSWVGFEPRVTGAHVDGQYVGGISWVIQTHLAEKLGAPCMNIWGLGVSEKYQRNRIASALISRAMASSYKMGARSASVGTQIWNTAAHMTYTRMGYRPLCIMMGRQRKVESQESGS